MNSIIVEVLGAVKGWEPIAKEIVISKAEPDLMRSAFERTIN